MERTTELTQTYVETPSISASSYRSGLEAWAQWERHFQEGDALIAAHFGLQTAWVTTLRERNFFYWEHLERRAKSEYRERLEYRGKDALTPRVKKRDASEYLTPSEYLRPSRREASLMSRIAPDWLGWGLIALVVIVLFGQAVFPEFHTFLKGFFQ